MHLNFPIKYVFVLSLVCYCCYCCYFCHICMVGKGHIGDMVTLKKASSSSSSAAASSAPSSASSAFASSSGSAFASAYPLKRFPTRRSVFCCRCCCRIFSTSTIIFRLRDLEITTSTQPSGIFSVLLVSK